MFRGRSASIAIMARRLPPRSTLFSGVFYPSTILVEVLTLYSATLNLFFTDMARDSSTLCVPHSGTRLFPTLRTKSRTSVAPHLEHELRYFLRIFRRCGNAFLSMYERLRQSGEQ